MNLLGLYFLFFHRSLTTGKLPIQKKIYPHKSSIKFSVKKLNSF